MSFKMTFRWYGNDDKITLDKIRQIPCMTGIVSAIYDTPVGEVWSNESILAMKKQIEDAGLAFEVVESVPVHEDIKLGNANAKRLIENYKENVRRLGKAGVKCICYNFMPVFDWLRSNLAKPLADGSNALAYDHETVLNLNPLTSELSLPGWDASYTKEGLKELLNQYKNIDEEYERIPQRSNTHCGGERSQDGNSPRRSTVGNIRLAESHYLREKSREIFIHSRQSCQRRNFLHRIFGRCA